MHKQTQIKPSYIIIIDKMFLGECPHPKYGDMFYASAELDADYYPSLEDTIDNAVVWVTDQDGGECGESDVNNLNTPLYEKAVKAITEAWQKETASLKKGKK